MGLDRPGDWKMIIDGDEVEASEGDRTEVRSPATGELAGLCVDQCELSEEGLFTLLAPDDYRGDTLEIGCFDRGGREVARESLYEDE